MHLLASKLYRTITENFSAIVNTCSDFFASKNFIELYRVILIEMLNLMRCKYSDNQQTVYILILLQALKLLSEECLDFLVLNHFIVQLNIKIFSEVSYFSEAEFFELFNNDIRRAKDNLISYKEKLYVIDTEKLKYDFKTDQDISFLKLEKVNSALTKTQNSYGSMISFEPEPYTSGFIVDAGKKNESVLVIGCAYGDDVKALLAEGASVVATDLSDEHLLYLKTTTPEEDRTRLTVIAGCTPELQLPENYFDKIIIRNVLHFMKGDRIVKTFKQCFDVLRPGGEFLFVATSPYMAIHDPFIPIYEERVKNNSEWPGFIENIREILEAQGSEFASQLPEWFHAIDPPSVEKCAKDIGFLVSRDICFAARPDYPPSAQTSEKYRDKDGNGRETVTGILIKPNI